MMFITRAEIPATMKIPTIVSGNFGRLLTTKRRCGWQNTNMVQNIAKYNIYGVKIASNKASANKNEYIGFGRFSP